MKWPYPWTALLVAFLIALAVVGIIRQRALTQSISECRARGGTLVQSAQGGRVCVGVDQ